MINYGKYRNKKINRDGMTFDSIKEYNHWMQLVYLQKIGQIIKLQRQVKYVLIPAQYEPDTIGKRGGVKKGKLIERECAYIADFVYEVLTPDGWQTIVVDTKGFKTKDYIIKRKLMLYIHGIRIKEV